MAQSEEAQATYTRRADHELRALRRDIDLKNSQLAVLKADLVGTQKGARIKIEALGVRIETLLGSLADAQTRFADALAARDADFARERALLLSVGNDLLSTPEGALALARYNAGGAGSFELADAVLAKLSDARDKALRDKARLRHAADERSRATLALDARGKGLTTTGTAITRFEAVVAIAPESFDDYIFLAQLYRDANRLDDAGIAAAKAYTVADSPARQARALVEQGDALMLQARDDAALREFDGGLAALTPILAAMAALTKAETKDQALAFGDVAASFIDKFSAMIAVFRAPAQIDQATRYYDAALGLSPPGEGPSTTPSDQVADRATTLIRLGDVHLLRSSADKVSVAQSAFRDMGRFFQEKVRKAVETGVWDQVAFNKDMAVRFAPVLVAMNDRTAVLKARDRFEESLRLREDLVARHPGNQAYQRAVADGLDHIGAAQVAGGAYDDATATYRRSLELRRTLVAADDRWLTLRSDLASTLRELGSVRDRAKDPANALPYLTECLAIRRALAKADPTSAVYQRNIATALAALASMKAPGFDWGMVEAQYQHMRTTRMFAPSDERDAHIAHMNALDVFKLK